MFLSGAVLEGVLTWAIQTRKGGSVDDVSKKKLGVLIQQGAELSLISSKAEEASWAVKDFRDLIHPYHVMRGSTRCKRMLATNVLSALSLILRSLQGRLTKVDGTVEIQDVVVNPNDSQAAENFSFAWLIPQKVGGARGPQSSGDLRLFRQLGVGAIVRLADRNEARVGTNQVEAEGLVDLHEPVRDFCAPALEQITRAITFIDGQIAAQKAVAITCGAGIGRTSTLLACYLVSMGLSASEALDQVNARYGHQPERAIQRDIIDAFEVRIRSKTGM